MARYYNRANGHCDHHAYETIIGIEVHAQLRTESKMFCSCPTAPPAGEPDEPNTRVCPVCLGLPGTLPVINRRAVELVMLTGLALDCQIETEAVRFERKNYFYPDLPKGYQISQYALPLCANGRLEVPVPARGGERQHRHHPGAPRGGHRPAAAWRPRLQPGRLQSGRACR